MNEDEQKFPYWNKEMLNIFYLLLVLCIFGTLYPFWTFLLICNKHWEWYKQKCFFNTCFWNVTLIVTSVTSFHHIKLPTSKQQIDGIMGFYWWQTHKGITIQTFNANKKVWKIPKHRLLYMSTIMYCRNVHFHIADGWKAWI